MNPLIVIVVFYGLLALALLLLRGDLTSWPVVADRILALVVSVAAVGWLVSGWSTRQPLTSPAGGGGGRPRSMWLWWAGLAGLAAVIFLVALPPLSRVLARPLDVERTAPGRDSMGENVPPVDGGTIPDRDPGGGGPWGWGCGGDGGRAGPIAVAAVAGGLAGAGADQTAVAGGDDDGGAGTGGGRMGVGVAASAATGAGRRPRTAAAVACGSFSSGVRA